MEGARFYGTGPNNNNKKLYVKVFDEKIKD